MSNAHTFHMLMLMSWSPGDGSGTPRGSPAKMRKKSTIRDSNEKNWIPHAYTRFDNCSVELLKALFFWHQWRGLQQVRHERADSQGVEAREGGALAGVFWSSWLASIASRGCVVT